ncbi:MAG TPA: hypothetical protein VGS57_08775 [Thermoanaerobaculia bacterium]|jgi:uncharacterized Zn-binding protein involved in type VI secretion|nr:hypothetical protein [Thermoanaerobaculia bacterium]
MAAAAMRSPGFAATLVDPGSAIWYTTAGAAGNLLSCGNRARIEGSLHSNGNVLINPGCTVTEDATAVGSVETHGTVQGQVISQAAARPLPVLPPEVQLRALANRFIEGDTTLSDAVVDDVLFVHGTARIQGRVRGTGTVIASRDLRLENLPDNTVATPDPQTRLALIAGNDIWVGKGRALRAALRAGRDVELHQDVQLEGVAVANRQLRVLERATIRHLDFDLHPPTITNLRPAEGTTISNRRPEIGASFSDDLSGVDLGSVHLLLDGSDRTAQATISATAVGFVPTADLATGTHVATVALADRSGKTATVSWSFSVRTSSPPTLNFTSPHATVLTQDPKIEVRVTMTDGGAVIAVSTFRITVDGTDFSSSCQVTAHDAVCSTPSLDSGTHGLVAFVLDALGNQGTTAIAFELRVDRGPPAVHVTTPAERVIVRDDTFVVSGTAQDDGELASVTVNGSPAALSGDTFTSTVHLVDGSNPLLVVAADTFGQRAGANAMVILDRVPPTLSLDSPASGQIVNGESVTVLGLATDTHGVQSVTVMDTPATIENGGFSGSAPLAEGGNDVRVTATDRAGNNSTKIVRVIRYSLPAVTIASPVDLAYVSSTTFEVRGTVSEGTTVSVNGVVASIAGTAFTAGQVPLIEGGNTITATARDLNGHVATATVHVVRDLTPPHVAVYWPADGATVYDPVIGVRGLVNDIVPGTVNSSEVSVTVNGLPAQVANRSFLVDAVPLVEGENVIRVVAVDASGNRGEVAVTATRAAANKPRIVAVSGAGQTAVIGTSLPNPLVAEVHDGSGNPVSGVPVIFKVAAGDGSFTNGKRLISASSNAAGRAEVSYTLGRRAGVATQVVQATAMQFLGSAVFTATAHAAGPSLVVVDSGSLQVGVTGHQLPRPLVAAVVDAGSNRLAGIPVVFQVVEGTGHFAPGGSSLTVPTDSDGRAIALFTVGEDEGTANNVVQATVQDLTDGTAATFVASGRAAGDPDATSVSGVVLDNIDRPVPGVTVRIRDTPLITTTDAQGQFRIDHPPIGAVKLVIDGSTAALPGSWPDLEFDMVTIAGRDTTVNMPIYLLPIDLQHGAYVDETHGATLTLPDFPGFALTIAPGSVTFPGGSRSGVVSATIVHNDRVPMIPNFGQQPKFIVTIQPPGARFDPPASLSLPNASGLPPGHVTEMYSFDHDLGHFVSIGPATVSNDGLVLKSDVGVGIVKAGWHCGGDPEKSGTTHHCKDCYQCVPPDNTCKPEALCKACTPGSACNGKGHCETGRELLAIPSVCEGVGVRTEPSPLDSCSAVPELAGIPDLCGAAMRVTYREVTHACDSIDLAGAVLNEEIEDDFGCGDPGPIRTGSCVVVKGNLLAPPGQVCRDYYYTCRQTDDWPMNQSCTETVTQKIYIDECLVETRKIVFTIVRDAQGCAGIAERH